MAAVLAPVWRKWVGPEPWPHSRNPSNWLHHLYREGTIVLENLLKKNTLFIVALLNQATWKVQEQ